MNALFPPSSAAAERPRGTEPTADLPRVPGYEVREVLGRGGIGIVYKARHLRLNRPVALKMLLVGAYAQAHEPGEAWFHCNDAWALLEAGQLDDALAEAREALRLNPGCDFEHAALSEAFWRQHRAPEALEESRQYVRCARPQNLGTARSRLRDLLLLTGQYPEARDAWREALAGDPPTHDAWFGYAELCLFLGDEDGYCRARTDLLKRFGDSPDPVTCERTAKACLLLDGDPAELKAAAALADRAAANEAKSELGYLEADDIEAVLAYAAWRMEEREEPLVTT